MFLGVSTWSRGLCNISMGHLCMIKLDEVINGHCTHELVRLDSTKVQIKFEHRLSSHAGFITSGYLGKIHRSNACVALFAYENCQPLPAQNNLVGLPRRTDIGDAILIEHHG